MYEIYGIERMKTDQSYMTLTDRLRKPKTSVSFFTRQLLCPLLVLVAKMESRAAIAGSLSLAAYYPPPPKPG